MFASVFGAVAAVFGLGVCFGVSLTRLLEADPPSRIAAAISMFCLLALGYPLETLLRLAQEMPQ